MAYTTVGFYESIDGAGAFHNIAAIQDDHVTVFGDNVRVPRNMDRLIGACVLSGADTSFLDARLLSPTLRRVFNPHLGILVNALVFGNPPEAMMHPLSPIPLTPDENITLQLLSDATAAKLEYGLVWFGDGPQQPVNGEIRTMKADASITLAAGTWVNGPLVFTEELPAGRYSVVGLRAQGTNLIAARLNFVGGFWRPGAPAVNALGDRDAKWFRNGRMGILGEFDQTSPPTIECLGVTDSTQEIWLDLIYLGQS